MKNIINKDIKEANKEVNMDIDIKESWRKRLVYFNPNEYIYDGVSAKEYKALSKRVNINDRGEVIFVPLEKMHKR